MFSRNQLLGLYEEHKNAFVQTFADIIVKDVLEAARFGQETLQLNETEIPLLKQRNPHAFKPFDNVGWMNGKTFGYRFPDPSPNEIVAKLKESFPDCAVILTEIMNPARALNPHAKPSFVWNICVDWSKMIVAK